MNLSAYLLGIQTHLLQTHAHVLRWFEEDAYIRNYRPKDGGWSINEILEHIWLTSHFLLKLIDKGTDKALRNVNDLSLEQALDEATFNLDHLDAIGAHKSFDWIRPEHMEPRGILDSTTVQQSLIDQLNHCLSQVLLLKNGEGLLYSTTMTVNGLGRLNVYEYIYFLSKHAERHLQQMAENREEFLEGKK